MPNKDNARHILVINDTIDILNAFRELLEDEGYRVSLDTFSSRDLARKVEDVKTLAPDLLILDFMFGLEPLGWQFVQLLKMDRAAATIPLIVCTAAVSAVEELTPHLRTLGIDVVLKPFDIDQLLASIDRTLQASIRPGGPGMPASATED
jgi:DNA-binding response OmpR family regulator